LYGHKLHAAQRQQFSARTLSRSASLLRIDDRSISLLLLLLLLL